MPTQDELVGGGDAIRYLWVGSHPRQFEDFDSAEKVNVNRAEQRAIPYEEEALREVVPVTSEPATWRYSTLKVIQIGG